MEVFVYGTLTDPDRARAVLDDGFEFGPDATLVGLRRVEGRYPTLASPTDASRRDGGGPGDDRETGTDEPSVEGRILRTDRVGVLDDYEGVDRGLYVRVRVPVHGDQCEERTWDGADGAAVYVGNPDRLGIEGVEWPGDGGFGDRVREYVTDGGVEVRIET
ncbi:gamma-glutamylcyclotransferase [Halobacteriales archaeon QS_8_69_26]|nr:MAG: gamma-glutamylcyclotransferase [Halobacteriales archaeon QS_8_69_26]